MKRNFLLGLGLWCIAVTLTGCPPSDNGQNDTSDNEHKTELEGTWLGTAEREWDHHVHHMEIKLEFRGSEVASSLSWHSDDGAWGETAQKGTFKLDTSQDPKHIDLFFTWESILEFTPGAELYEQAGTLEDVYREEYALYPEEYPWLIELDGTLTQMALGIYRVAGNELTIQFGAFHEHPSDFHDHALALTRE